MLDVKESNAIIHAQSILYRQEKVLEEALTMVTDPTRKEQIERDIYACKVGYHWLLQISIDLYFDGVTHDINGGEIDDKRSYREKNA